MHCETKNQNQKLILDSDFFFKYFFNPGRNSRQENRRQRYNDDQPEMTANQNTDTHRLTRGQSRQAKIRHYLKKEGLRNRDR